MEFSLSVRSAKAMCVFSSSVRAGWLAASRSRFLFSVTYKAYKMQRMTIAAQNEAKVTATPVV